MKARQSILAAALLMLAWATLAHAQQTAEELYQAGLYQEEVKGDLERAIQLYSDIVERHGDARPVNPLMLDENSALAADARVVVEYRQPDADRYAHMAIYPYPAQLVSQWQLADGTDITIRPIRPEDADIEKKFVHDLSDESKYFRFMNSMQELTDNMLVRFTQLDYSREMALIAVVEEQGSEIELGVARYAINPDGDSCEFALVIADNMQGKGLGQKLMTALMEAARDKGLKAIEGEVLSNNHNMLKLMTRLGFATKSSEEDPSIVKVSKML